MVMSACGGDTGESATVTTAVTQAVSSTAATTTTNPVPPDPFALTDPQDVRMEGSCRPEVFPEDETGTTWLISCSLAHSGDVASVHPAVKATEYASHFRYVVDADDELSAISLEPPLIRNRLCGWSSVDFTPFDVPIVDDEITYDGVLDGTESCDGLSWSYSFTWNVETDSVVMDGVLEPGSAS